MTNTTTKRVDFHGIPLHVQAFPQFLGPLENLYWSFPDGADSTDELSMQLVAVDDPREITFEAPPGARIVYSRRAAEEDPLDAGLEFDIYHAGGAVFVDLGDRGVIEIDGASAAARIVNPAELHDDVLGSLLLFTLVELLKTRNVYMIHAATLVRDGRAIVIPGTRGKGKTTSCLALATNGYQFLSDDVTFFRENNGDIELLSFPERVSVTQGTIELIPVLKERRDALRDGFLKQHFVIDDILPGIRTECATPGLILFPELTGSKRSELETIPASRALESILPQGLSVLDRESAREQFRLLSLLVQRSTCHRLHFGSDIHALPDLVAQAMEEIDAPTP